MVFLCLPLFCFSFHPWNINSFIFISIIFKLSTATREEDPKLRRRKGRTSGIVSVAPERFIEIHIQGDHFWGFLLLLRSQFMQIKWSPLHICNIFRPNRIRPLGTLQFQTTTPAITVEEAEEAWPSKTRRMCIIEDVSVLVKGGRTNGCSLRLCLLV